MWWYQLLSMVYHKSSKTHCYMYLVSAGYPVHCERKHQSGNLRNSVPAKWKITFKV